MAIDVQTPDDILSVGLTIVGFPEQRQKRVQRQKNLARFSQHFGSQPIVYSRMWGDLQRYKDEDGDIIIDISRNKTDVKRFLMTICFLYVYPKELQSEGKFGLSDRTIRDWVWWCLDKIVELKPFKIRWPKRWNPNEDDSDETTFILSVDGVHCRIVEPMHGEYSKNPEFYSHKFKQSALDYEVAVSIFTQQVVWINGPFPAGKNDISVFKSKDGLAAEMDAKAPGKLGIADLGYRGSGGRLSTPNSHDAPEVRVFKSQVLARGESYCVFAPIVQARRTSACVAEFSTCDAPLV